MQDYTNQPIYFNRVPQNQTIDQHSRGGSLEIKPILVNRELASKKLRGQLKASSVMASRQESRETSPLGGKLSPQIYKTIRPTLPPKTQQSSPREALPDRKMNNSVDMAVRYTVSINDIVKSNIRKYGDSVFGITGYHLPNTELVTGRPRTTKFTTYNVPHFIDNYSKSKAFIPGPKYETLIDWKNSLQNKGKFTKSPRITYTQSIIAECKLRETPGPGAYHLKGNSEGPYKRENKSPSTADKQAKICAFIEEAKYRSIQTPFAKYNVQYQVVDAEKKEAKFYKSIVNRMERIQKDPSKPSPGDYNTTEAFNKTQTQQFHFKVGNQKIKSFIEQAQKNKSYLPGIGAYKVSSKAYDMLSKSPASIRVLRH